MGRWHQDSNAKSSHESQYVLNNGKVIDMNKALGDQGLTEEEMKEYTEDLRNNALTAPNPLGDGTTQTNPFKAANVENQPGSTLDTASADLQRAKMSGLLEQLQQQAATGHGSWENTFNAAVARNKDAATALGSSSPGTDYGSSLRNIGAARGAVDARSAGAHDTLQAQAQLDARSQMGDLLGQQAQTDIAQSAQSAAARQQTREMQASLDEQARTNTTNTVGGLAQGIPVAGAGVSGAVKAGDSSGMSEGGRVPGKPVVFGDDSRNDTVPAMLSPEEIVVPISAATDPDKAAEFARAVAERGGAQHLAGGGFLGGPQRQAPSVENGGLLQREQLNETQGRQDALAALFAGQAIGAGPSIVMPRLQRETDDTIGAAHAADQRGAPQSAILGAAGAAGAGATEAAGGQAASEASRGQASLGHMFQQRRAQELAMANASQQAGWRNTALNSGMSLKDQAALQGMLSGAGQGAASFASMGGGERPTTVSGGGFTGTSDTSKWSEGELRDLAGERGGITDPTHGNSLASTLDSEGMAFGGSVGGYADGGEVESPEMHSLRMQARKEGADWAKEDKPVESREMEALRKKAAKGGAEWAQKKPDARQRLEEFAKSLSASASGMVPHMADGGPVLQSYDPAMFSSQPPAPQPAGPDWFMAPSSQVRPGELPPQLAAMAADAAGRDQRYPVAPTSAAPPAQTEAEKAISRDMGAPPTTAHADAEKAQRERAARDAAGIRPGLGSGATSTPPAPAAPPSTPAIAKPAGSSAPAFGSKADTEAKAAAQSGYEAQTAQAQATVDAAAAEASAIESHVAERKALAARVQDRIMTGQTKFAQAVDDMARIDTTVDPGRFWATRSTGDRVMGILGLVLGALGAGQDGVNRAAVMLNQAVDRDLDAQKAQHELRLKQGGARIDAARSYYAMARDAGGDELSAMDLAHAAALQAVAAKGRQLLAKTGNLQAKAQLQGLVAAVDQGAAQRQATGWEKAQDRALEREKIEASKVKGGVSTERMKVADDVNTAAGNITRNAAVLKEFIGKYGTQEKWTPGVEEDMQRRSTEIATELAKMLDPSTGVRDPEMDRWSKLVFQPGYLQRDANAQATLDNLMGAVEARRQTALRVRGMP